MIRGDQLITSGLTYIKKIKNKKQKGASVVSYKKKKDQKGNIRTVTNTEIKQFLVYIENRFHIETKYMPVEQKMR